MPDLIYHENDEITVTFQLADPAGIVPMTDVDDVDFIFIKEGVEFSRPGEVADDTLGLVSCELVDEGSIPAGLYRLTIVHGGLNYPSDRDLSVYVRSAGVAS